MESQLQLAKMEKFKTLEHWTLKDLIRRFMQKLEKKKMEDPLVLGDDIYQSNSKTILRLMKLKEMKT